MTTGCITPKGHTGIEQRRAERRLDPSAPMPASRGFGTRTKADRRISPAIGQFAIADRARLIRRVADLEAALRDAKRYAGSMPANSAHGTRWAKWLFAHYEVLDSIPTPAPEGKS